MSEAYSLATIQSIKANQIKMAEAMGYSTNLAGEDHAQMITVTSEVIKLVDFPKLVDKVQLVEGHIYDNPKLFEQLFDDHYTKSSKGRRLAPRIREIVPLFSTCYYQKVTVRERVKSKVRMVEKTKRGMFIFLDGIKDIKEVASQLIGIITSWFESKQQDQVMVDLVMIMTNISKVVTDIVNPVVVKYSLGQIQPRFIPFKSFLLSAFSHYLSPTISVASDEEVKEIIETAGASNSSVFPVICRDDPLAIGYDLKTVLAIKRQDGGLYYRLVRGTTMIHRANTVT